MNFLLSDTISLHSSLHSAAGSLYPYAAKAGKRYRDARSKGRIQGMSAIVTAKVGTAKLGAKTTAKQAKKQVYTGRRS